MPLDFLDLVLREKRGAVFVDSKLFGDGTRNVFAVAGEHDDAHAVRPQAGYERTLGVLRYVKEKDPTILTKTGFMVGLGETDEQISVLMDDILATGCDILTIGQYLQPSEKHWKLDRYATPEDFARYKQLALSKGFRHVASAPLARSSYRAWEALEDVHDLY